MAHADKIIADYRFYITGFEKTVLGRIVQVANMDASESIGAYNYETNYIIAYPDGLEPDTPSSNSKDECEKDLFSYVKNIELYTEKGDLRAIKEVVGFYD